MNFIKLLTIVVIFASGCKTKDMIYKYSDGSGNTFIINKNRIEFQPVKKESSSTGYYDMGDVKLKEISGSDFKSIKKLFEDAIKSKEDHIENRIMTSGQIIVIESKEMKKRYILSPKSKYKSEIEEKLNNLITTK